MSSVAILRGVKVVPVGCDGLQAALMEGLGILRVAVLAIWTRSHAMADRDAYLAVERTPGTVSGAWVVTGTLIPLSDLYEKLAGSATVDEFIEWFPGVDRKQMRAVPEHDAQALRTAPRPQHVQDLPNHH